MATSRSGDPTGRLVAAGDLPAWGHAGVTTVLGLLVVSLLPWRTEAFYAGGSDPVVLAKAALSLLALALAWCLTGWRSVGRLRPRTCVLVGAYVVCSMLGARAAGTTTASAILGVRVLLVLAVVALVVAATRPAALVRALAAAFGLVGGVLALSGVPALLTGEQTGNNAGRLAGALLPVSPNLLCMLLAVPALVLGHELLGTRPRARHLVGLVTILAATWLTGSRAGMVALVLALVFVLAHRRARAWAWGTVLLLVAAGVCALAVTSVVGDFLGRGGVEQLSTLNSRTVAWQAVLDRGTSPFMSWWGEGLAVKTVPVTGAQGAVDRQVIDSTWVSSYVQAGLVGLALLGWWALGTLWLAIASRTSYRVLWTALAGYAVARSVLETGLLDTYVLFVVMLVPALSLDLERAPADDADGAGGGGQDAREARTVAGRAAGES